MRWTKRRFVVTQLILLLLAIASLPPSSLAFGVAAPLVHTVIGAASGCMGAMAAYPLDMIKSQLQTEQGRKYSGGMEAAIDIVRSSGPFGLYRGAFVNVLGIAPEKTIKLGMNDFLRGCINAHFGQLPVVGEIVAGGGAGLCQVIATNPLEVVKVKLQTSNSSVWEVLGEVGGFSGLYKGAEACAARDVIFSSFLFPVFAHAKIVMPGILMSLMGGGVEPSPFWSDLIAGSLAAAPAAFLATPADTVKTRLQQARANGENVDDLNALGVAKEIVAREGGHVLFSGAFERVVRSIPQFGVTLALFGVLNSAAIDLGLLPS